MVIEAREVAEQATGDPVHPVGRQFPIGGADEDEEGLTVQESAGGCGVGGAIVLPELLLRASGGILNQE